MYATGEGVLKDEAEAVRWYRKAAEQGALWPSSTSSHNNGRGVLRIPWPHVVQHRWRKRERKRQEVV